MAIPYSPFRKAVISSEHPVDRFLRNACAVGVEHFALTFYNFLKLTYHNHHSSSEEAEGGIRGFLI